MLPGRTISALYDFMRGQKALSYAMKTKGQEIQPKLETKEILNVNNLIAMSRRVSS